MRLRRYISEHLPLTYLTVKAVRRADKILSELEKVTLLRYVSGAPTRSSQIVGNRHQSTSTATYSSLHSHGMCVSSASACDNCSDTTACCYISQSSKQAIQVHVA